MSLKKTEEMGKGAPSAFVDIWKKKIRWKLGGTIKMFLVFVFFHWNNLVYVSNHCLLHVRYKGSGPIFFYCELDKLRHVYGKCHLVSPMINMKQTDSTVYIYMIDNNDFSIVLADISLSLVLYWQSTYHCH